MFARRLREARAGAGMSLDELGTVIGKDASTISRWENGSMRRTPSYDVLEKLETALGYDTLLDAAGYSLSTPEEPDAVDRELIAAIVNRVLDAQREQIATAIADELAERN